MVQRQKGFGFITPDDSGTGGCRSLEENQKVSDTVPVTFFMTPGQGVADLPGSV